MKKVVIIEDYTPVSESFKQTINSSNLFLVTQVFQSCEEAIENLKNIEVDIILMDISLPGMNGIEGTKKIKKLLPDVKIIIISVHKNSKFVFDALCAGALGYLTKNITSSKLILALQELNNGGSPMSANIARMVVESFQFNKPNELTNREADVLEMLVKGTSYSAIAENLFLSINTVKYHIRNIYEKLHVSNRYEAVEEAKSRKIIKK